MYLVKTEVNQRVVLVPLCLQPLCCSVCTRERYCYPKCWKAAGVMKQVIFFAPQELTEVLLPGYVTEPVSFVGARVRCFASVTFVCWWHGAKFSQNPPPSSCTLIQVTEVHSKCSVQLLNSSICVLATAHSQFCLFFVLSTLLQKWTFSICELIQNLRRYESRLLREEEKKIDSHKSKSPWARLWTLNFSLDVSCFG